MPIELVIWDYNGTLTDDLPRFTRAVNIFLIEHNVSPANEEEVACYDGDIWKFYQKRNITLSKAEIGTRVFEIYSQLPDPIYLRALAVETLEAIDKPQVLVTKHPTPLTEKEVDGLGIRKYFHQIYSGVRNKIPLFQQLCSERTIMLSSAAVVGDTVNDIKEGKLAGNKVIAIPGYHPKHILEQQNPDYLINSLWEAYGYILNKF